MIELIVVPRTVAIVARLTSGHLIPHQCAWETDHTNRFVPARIDADKTFALSSEPASVIFRFFAMLMLTERANLRYRIGKHEYTRSNNIYLRKGTLHR